MEIHDRRSLESLSLFCHFSGLFSVFVGLVIAFIDLFNGDKRHLPVAIYIFFTGYANVKISSKLSEILNQEK